MSENAWIVRKLGEKKSQIRPSTYRLIRELVLVEPMARWSDEPIPREPYLLALAPGVIIRPNVRPAWGWAFLGVQAPGTAPVKGAVGERDKLVFRAWVNGRGLYRVGAV